VSYREVSVTDLVCQALCFALKGRHLMKQHFEAKLKKNNESLKGEVQTQT
jgi:hypothetical protein